MTQADNDLDLKHLFRVIFMQGGQVAIGTAIGAGVVLLVGIVAVFLAPIWLPIFTIWYWRKEKRAQAATATGPNASAPGSPESPIPAASAGPLAPGEHRVVS